MAAVKTLTLAQARRMALAAQGFGRPQPAGVSLRHITSVVDRLGVVQIDSVNVVERSHLVPFYSRLGPYDKTLVQRALAKTPLQLLEAWAHEASIVRPEVYHLLEWRRARSSHEAWGRMRRVVELYPELKDGIVELLEAKGPLCASEVNQVFEEHYPSNPTEEWGWNWTLPKAALEWLFFTGQVASAGRNASFSRFYQIAHRVVPPRGDLPTDHKEQITKLADKAARAQGVATVA